MPDGTALAFQYVPALRDVHLPGECIHINEHGWEVGREIEA